MKGLAIEALVRLIERFLNRAPNVDRELIERRRAKRDRELNRKWK